MRKNLTMIAVLASAFLTSLTFAEGSTGYGMLPETLIYSGHSGLLVRHINMIDPDACGRKDWLILPETHPKYKEAFALIIAAHLAKQRVWLSISGCHQGIPAIQHVGMAQD